MLRKRRRNDNKQLLHLLRRRCTRSQPSKASDLILRLELAGLRRAVAEIIIKRRVIKDASGTILGPLPGIAFLRRLRDLRHFPNDGNQRTRIYVLKEVLSIVVWKNRIGTHFP